MNFTLISEIYLLIDSKLELIVNSNVYSLINYIAPILTVLMTIRFIMLGLLSLYNPGAGDSLTLLLKDYLRVAIILSFATSGGWYQKTLIATAMDLPDELSEFIFMIDKSSGMDMIYSLDKNITDCINFIDKAFSNSENSDSHSVFKDRSAGVIMIITSAFYCGISAGLIIVSKLLLGITLCFGPAALVCLIWDATRGLFTGWLSTLIRYEVLSLLLMMVMGMFMVLFNKLVQHLAPGKDVMVIAISALILAVINCFVFFQVYLLASHWGQGLCSVFGSASAVFSAGTTGAAGGTVAHGTSGGSPAVGQPATASAATSTNSESGLAGRARGSRSL